jgi:hypothetical protein
LEQGRDDDGKEDAVIQLAKGLSENQSITELSIIGAKLNDSSLATLSKSLTGHSVLSRLSLENICRDESLQSLASLLAAPSCNLSHLDLTHQYANSQDKMNLGLLVVGLKQNESLESLDLTGNYLNQDDFSMLWDAIQSGFCSNLVYLNLAYNKIAKLAPSNRLNESSRLRSLDLTGNPILKSEDPDIKSFLIDLVQNQPHLGYIGKIVGISNIYCPVLGHNLDLNRAGRIMLERDLSTPLSVWPVVLERCNRVLQESPERNASTMYGLVSRLLLGPLGGQIDKK